MSRISRDQVLYVADLARLSLSDAEAEAMTAELDTILEYAETLRSVETGGIEPTSHPLPMRTPFREDRAEAGVPAELAVANAPDRDGTAFVVPKVLDTDET